MDIHTHVHIDLGDVQKGFDEMTRKTVLLPVMQALKAPLRADQKDHAKAKSGPDAPWAPRAQSTIDARRGKRKLPRKLLGKLPTAVSYKATYNAVVGESRVPWSRVQAEGGIVGHGARLPAREFLWISDGLVHKAEGLVTMYLAKAFEGTR
jgi:hypothetical protein